LGIENSRHDDLESLAYVFIYFLQGSLPWQSLENATKAWNYQQIMKRKRTIPTNALCHGLPDEFGIFLDYTRALKFDDRPDYPYLCKLFCDLFA
jgi:casein kinase I family protein HRR25